MERCQSSDTVTAELDEALFEELMITRQDRSTDLHAATQEATGDANWDLPGLVAVSISAQDLLAKAA